MKWYSKTSFVLTVLVIILTLTTLKVTEHDSYPETLTIIGIALCILITLWAFHTIICYIDGNRIQVPNHDVEAETISILFNKRTSSTVPRQSNVAIDDKPNIPPDVAAMAYIAVR